MARTMIGIPAFNEEPRIGEVLRNLIDSKMSCSHGDRLDVVVLDDGSTDGTFEVARTMGVMVEKHSANSGYGKTLADLFQLAISGGYDYLITMDADGQHCPTYVQQFVLADERQIIVSGSRYLPSSIRLSDPPAGLLNPFFADIVSRLTEFSITDIGCGMKRYKLPEAAALSPQQSDYGAAFEMWILAWNAGYAPMEIAVPMVYVPDKVPLPERFASKEEAFEFGLSAIIMAIVAPKLPRRFLPGWRDQLAFVPSERLAGAQHELARLAHCLEQSANQLGRDGNAGIRLIREVEARLGQRQ